MTSTITYPITTHTHKVTIYLVWTFIQSGKEERNKHTHKDRHDM